MAKVSKKTRKENQELDPERKKWRLTFKRCFICNRRAPAHVHEILGGSEWRYITRHLVCFYLAVCERCHAEIQSNSDWPAARQLAHKLIHDPKGFDLIKFNATTAGSRIEVTMKQIDSYLNELAG